MARAQLCYLVLIVVVVVTIIKVIIIISVGTHRWQHLIQTQI